MRVLTHKIDPNAICNFSCPNYTFDLLMGVGWLIHSEDNGGIVVVWYIYIYIVGYMEEGY